MLLPNKLSMSKITIGIVSKQSWLAPCQQPTQQNAQKHDRPEASTPGKSKKSRGMAEIIQARQVQKNQEGFFDSAHRWDDTEFPRVFGNGTQRSSVFFEACSVTVLMETCCELASPCESGRIL
jgi:hypothetical protein